MISLKSKFPFVLIRGDIYQQALDERDTAKQRANTAELNARQIKANYEQRLNQLAGLAEDMNLIGVHVFRDNARHSVQVSFEVSHEQFWYAMRSSSQGARDLIAYMIEREIVTHPDTRKVYYGA